MVRIYRYTLDPGSSKYICPACQKKRFVRYIDSFLGEFLPEIYGRCDRVENCRYHLNPYKDGYNRSPDFHKDYGKALKRKSNIAVVRSEQQNSQISSIPLTTFMESRNNYDQNNLIKWMRTIFPAEGVNEMIKMYHLGTSGFWPGSTIFWQIDKDFRIRTGKIMLYDYATGRRIKEPFNHIQWVHKICGKVNFNLAQCIFGEHLVSIHEDKPIGIVESEKTAIISAIHFPKYIWLATGGLLNMNPNRFKILTGRTVFFFPDLGGFERWQSKIDEIAETVPSAKLYVDSILEDLADGSMKKAGFDLGDFLIRHKLSLSE